MRIFSSKVLRNRAGQSLVEYIMLIALIALVVVGALKMLGGSTREAYSKAADMMENVNEEADSGGE